MRLSDFLKGSRAGIVSPSDLFAEGERLAAGRDHESAIQRYEAALALASRSDSGLGPGESDRFRRSVAFNLAQQLNHAGRHARALEVIDLGLQLSPSAVGLAIAHAARGEALCGLGRITEADTAFADSVRHHPIIGRLNAADSMSRESSGAFLGTARAWVRLVSEVHGNELSPELREELRTITRRLEDRRTSR